MKDAIFYGFKGNQYVVMGSEVYIANGESFKLCDTSKQMTLFFKQLLEKKLQTYSNYDLNGIVWGLFPIIEQLGYQVESFKLDNSTDVLFAPNFSLDDFDDEFLEIELLELAEDTQLK